MQGFFENLMKNVVLKSLRDLPFACAVCFGNPNSLLSKGVVAGVLLLMGVIATLLAGIVGVGLVWLRRARKLASEPPIFKP